MVIHPVVSMTLYLLEIFHTILKGVESKPSCLMKKIYLWIHQKATWE